MKKQEIHKAVIGLLVLQTILVIVLLVQVSSLKNAIGGTAVPTEPSAAPTPSENQGAPTVEVSADDDPSIGPDNAKVVVIEFSDFQCPYCGAAMGTHTALIERFKSQNPDWEAAVPKLKELAKQGKIKFVYRDFPLSMHNNAQKAAEAAECADEQGKFWEYHNVLFKNQEALTVPSLKQYAADIGLDTADFNSCLDSGKMSAEVQKDISDGQKAGVSGTPAFIVNGQLISGAQPYSVFEQLINAELSK